MGMKHKEKEEKEILRDDAYLYADKSGEPELVFLCMAFVAMCIVAFILTR